MRAKYNEISIDQTTFGWFDNLTEPNQPNENKRIK